MMASLALSLLLLLFAFVENARRGVFWPTALFWALILGIVVVIAAQILLLGSGLGSRRVAALVLGEIVLSALAIRLLFVAPGQILTAYDPYNEVIALHLISTWPQWIPDLAGGQSTNYPAVYLLAIVVSELSGLEMVTAAKYLSLAYFFVPTLFVYLLSRWMSGSRSLALLVSLGFSFIYITLVFHTQFSREALAIPLFLMVVYTLVPRREGEIKWRSMALVGAGALVLTHHLTSFLLLLLLASVVAARVVVHLTRQRRSVQRMTHRRRRTEYATGFLLAAVVMTVGYWTFLRLTPLNFFVLSLIEASEPDPTAGFFLPAGLRFQILLWGEIFFISLFLLLGLAAVLLRKDGPVAFRWGLLAFGILVGIMLFLTVEGRLVRNTTLGLGARLETSLFLAVIPLAACAFHRPKGGRRRWHGLFAVLVLAFLVLNVYRIPPQLHSDVGYGLGDPRPQISEAEFAAAFFIGLGQDEVIADPALNGVLQYAGYFALPLGNPALTDFVLHTGVRPSLTLPYLSDSAPRLYDNGHVAIYAEGPTAGAGA